MTIALVPIRFTLSLEQQAVLLGRLAQTFHAEVRLVPATFDPQVAWDSARAQVNALLLLEQLVAMPLPRDVRRLAILGDDLFMPMLTHVFGQAQLRGCAAVVSVYRLNNALYGLMPDGALLLSRMVKEAVHELGHTYGLVHCAHPDCVMHSSTTVEELDIKGPTFCDRCLREGA